MTSTPPTPQNSPIPTLPTVGNQRRRSPLRRAAVAAIEYAMVLSMVSVGGVVGAQQLGSELQGVFANALPLGDAGSAAPKGKKPGKGKKPTDKNKGKNDKGKDKSKPKDKGKPSEKSKAKDQGKAKDKGKAKDAGKSKPKEKGKSKDNKPGTSAAKSGKAKGK